MYENRPNLETRSKIVATLGPASWDDPTLSNLLLTGVDVCRINCSHADHDGIRRQVARVRRAAMNQDLHVAILLDLQGPKIRTGRVPEALDLSEGDILTIVMDEAYVAEGKRTGTTYPEMADDVSPGVHVLFADGALSGRVKEVRRDISPAEVDIQMLDGGFLGSHKGINLPGVAMSVPCLTEKDIADLAVGVEVGVDYVALSFVRRPEDVLELKERLAALGSPEMPVIAKIEKPQAVDAIEEILAVTDGVMVARGDLGVEVPIEQVPVFQKRIIAAASKHGKLCITATQMLDSMERNPRPTRAETTDVANAILDGTDAVMLSGETAMGAYPLDAVRMMDSIARSVESSPFFEPGVENVSAGPLKVLIRAAAAAILDKPRPIVVFTTSGFTAIHVSKARPMSPIFALTPDAQVADRLALCWGVTPLVMQHVQNTDDMIVQGVHKLRELGHVRAGEDVVVLAGQAAHRTANLLMIYDVPEE